MKKRTRIADRFLSCFGGDTPLWRRSSKRKKPGGKPTLGVEFLEDRLVPTTNCGCDAIIDPLVPNSAMTNIAVNSGAWTDPNTWANGKAPVAGANVLISQGVDVTLNQVISAPIHTIRVDGELDFAPHANTGLNVDTLVVNDSGVLLIGTATNPIDANHTATITFTDSGPINTQWDPNLISRGLLSAGTVSMYGAVKTAYESLAVDPTAGSTTLTLSQAPTGWNVGDRLIVTGTTSDGSNTGDDDVKIASINGNKVTLTSALKYNHLTPQAGLSVYVTDLTRNVVLQSQNPSDIKGHGHVMFMTDTVSLNYVAFDDLGRTDKTVPVNDPVLNSQGQLIPGTGTNPRGRYAVHFHEVGTDPTQAPAYVAGCAVVDSPGWGYVNHDSYVNFVNDVAYNVVGAAFVTESGSEIGSFQNCLAIHEVGDGANPSIGPATRQNVQDFGHGGDGFWLQGFGVSVINCIAEGAAEVGFEFYGRGLIQNGVTSRFQAVNLQNPSWAKGQATVDVQSVALAPFTGDTAFNDYYGVRVDYELSHPLFAGERSTMNNLTVWNANEGVILDYSKNLTLQNSLIVANPSGGAVGVIEGDEAVTGIQLTNLRVEGWRQGVFVSQGGTNIISGGYYNNVVNIEVPAAYALGRTVTISNVQFGTPSSSLLKGHTHYNIQLSESIASLSQYNPSIFFIPSVVTYNGQQLYWTQQAANFVPFPTSSVDPHLPATLIGKTNQQLWNQYGLAIGGAVAPPTAKSIAGINGLVGSAATYLPTVTLKSAAKASHTQPYMLSYRVTNGSLVKVSTPFSLKVGWNAITVSINGHLQTLFVLGT